MHFVVDGPVIAQNAGTHDGQVPDDLCALFLLHLIINADLGRLMFILKNPLRYTEKIGYF